jgi:hypothetical protein
MANTTILRGVRDAKIAAWNGVGSYGTEYDIYGIREAGIEVVMNTDELRGDDVVLDRYTKAESVTVSFANAAVDVELLELLSGGTMVSNANYEDVVIGEDDTTPYVSLAFRVVGSDGREIHYWLPKAKLSGNLQYQAAEGAYTIPQAEFQGVNEGATNGFLRVRNFAAATALEIPLRTSTGGL